MNGRSIAGSRLGLTSMACCRRSCHRIQRHLQSSAARSGLGASGVAELDRGFIRLDGPDALPFLQGLTTNDTSLLSTDQMQCQYTSMLHPKGTTNPWWLHLCTCLYSADKILSGCAARRSRAVGDVPVVISKYSYA